MQLKMANSNAQLTSIPEQSILEVYFLALGQYNYDRAKEQAEKEREAMRSASGSASWFWVNTLGMLSRLAVAEKNYASLTYLSPKWFGKKESMKLTYSSLVTDLGSMEQSGAGQTGQAQQTEVLLAHICDQIRHFCEARTETVEFYDKLCPMGNQRTDVDYGELLSTVDGLIATHGHHFHHPLLIPIKQRFTLELEVLQGLLKAHQFMLDWQFLPTLLQLHNVHSKLENLGANIRFKEGKKSGVVIPSKAVGVPPLYQWLARFKAAQVSKFSLYFHDSLSKQALSTSEFKGHLANLLVDHRAKIIAFSKKADALNVSVVYDTNNAIEVFKGHGYHHPYSQHEVPTGLDSYPAIFSYPEEKPIRLWPMVVMLLNSKADELTDLDRVIYSFDKTQSMTYFITRLEGRFSLVVIFNSKKSERDSYIKSFMQEMNMLLRGSNIFASLRLGHKN
ncbi:KICSTOR complex protein C12orf66 homolog [Anneissia japonica]|uniref:KICSTOR complex protein C12orf66 homolog n=1 Tax=Anneissia japonica TaxID=1529436 RepID=UPI0014255D1B|nr:KICSTOR complex protein C12orf66 homolog [Anneissia japonica]